ncbi:MAG TPA: NAD(P)/FAD-dependent oxidoreductase [Solirubrobacteraceae bacterium]
MSADSKHRVVVIGGGFGGLETVKPLRGAPGISVTLVDWRNFHLFQPLTYQVATGSLSPSDVTYPLRAVFGSAPNVNVLLAAVSGFDLDARKVLLVADEPTHPPASLEYDTLVVAAGSSYSYFGHEEWREVAGEVKSLESAISVRSRLLTALERAEIATDGGDRAAAATVVVVGGGPTGVEIAGQIGELARDTLHRDFKNVHSGDVRILLVEMADRLLTAFPESLSAKASRFLRAVGVTPRLNSTVVDVDSDGVTLKAPDGSTERIRACTVIWAAGVRASDLASKLGEQAGTDIDRAGRVAVGPDLTLAGHPEVLVLGDMASVRDRHGDPLNLPGLAPVAIQQGHFAARLIQHRLSGRPTRAFHYINKGNLATIGRGRAVADLGVIRLSGPPAWLIWLGVHIWYLIGYQNRLVVMLRWSISFLSHGRAQGSRIIGEVSPSEAPSRAGPGSA